MLALQPKQVRIALIALIALCGLTAGFFAAQLAGYLLTPPAGPEAPGRLTPSRPVARPEAADADLILSRNIFDPTARGQARRSSPQAATARDEAPETVEAAGNLKLFGTVDGGDNPLALIETAGKVRIFRLGDAIPGGGELVEISRNEVVMRRTDGSRSRLAIIRPSVGAPAERVEEDDEPTAAGIRSIGENRWSVSRDEVEKARNNLNQLLKSARMEPNIVNGQTEGFIVRMVRPKSLLAELGIQRGDTVTRVNGVELNSPEKALQIFQQLREAKRLTVDLKRGDENLTYEYEVN